MMITAEQLRAFQRDMLENEIAPATARRYRSVAEDFVRWAGDRPITKELLLDWRNSLSQSASTINVAVAAVNRLLQFLGYGELRLKHVKTQRSVYRPADQELSREEYERLVTTAERQNKPRLARAIETTQRYLKETVSAHFERVQRRSLRLNE